MDAKLLIVADLGLIRAHLVSPTLEGSPHVELVEEVVLEPSHHRFTDEVTDQAGRRSGPTRRNWAAPLADAHKLLLETRRRLIKEMAGHIQRLAQIHSDYGLWLAAQKEINQTILKALPIAVRQRIETDLACDLVKTEKSDLVKWFAPRWQARKPEPPPRRRRNRRIAKARTVPR